LTSGFCIFHDNDYLLQDKTNYEEHKRKILDRLKHKVNHAISINEPLFCIGFQLPEFSLSDLGIISKEFTIPVYFSDSQFFGKADFTGAKLQGITFDRANFQGKADFTEAHFQLEANFEIANFQGEVYFSYAKFQGKVDFSEASFQQAHFNSATFQGEADFSEAHFKDAAFSRANFGGKAFFIRAKFGWEANFCEVPPSYRLWIWENDLQKATVDLRLR
jgi:hypothetical protein